jgi:hypothetical protein
VLLYHVSSISEGEEVVENLSVSEEYAMAVRWRRDGPDKRVRELRAWIKGNDRDICVEC